MARRPEYRHEIKRGKFADWPNNAITPEAIASRVTYTGSTLHKTYPSPAGDPAWRSNKTKCPRYRREDWSSIADALKQAIRAQSVGEFKGDFPNRVWIWINDVLNEARLTNSETGDYHGFPIYDPAQYPEPIERLEDLPRVNIPCD